MSTATLPAKVTDAIAGIFTCCGKVYVKAVMKKADETFAKNLEKTNKMIIIFL